MSNSKSAADVTTTPAGLDVAITEPGTIVGSKDLQGTDGTDRTDRPGEILGTPVLSAASADRRSESRKREADRADYQTSEVDRANREELPRLGGPVSDEWSRDDAKKATAADEAGVAATVRAQAANRTTDLAPSAPRMPAPAAPRDSGIRVSPNVDRGNG